MTDTSLFRRSVSLLLAAGTASAIVLSAAPLGAQADEAERLLKEYVAFDTSNPPGDTRKTADWLAALFAREGIPVTRYESAPGKAIIYARLAATGARAGKAIVLLHHMDVVPADRARWKTDPFMPVVEGGDLLGRGTMDMKGIGVSELLAFLRLKREKVPLARDVILLAEPDEELGGGLGARWMIANHFAELDPEYVIDEGGMGSRDLFATGKLVYGISVAEKKIVWLKIRAEGVAGHGSQPNDQNPNDRLVRGLGRLLAQPMPTGDFAVVDTMKKRIGPFAPNKFMNAIGHSTISLTWIRSGVGEPPKTNVIPSVAEAALDCRVLPGTSRDQWVAEIRRRLGDDGLKIEVINESDDPMTTPDDTPMFEQLQAAILKRHPDAIVTPMVVPYGTDSNAFRPKGVKSYGIFPALLPAAVVAQMHGDAERVPLAGVREAADIFFDAVRMTAAPH
ncbi:MAG TPA: M20/M25/M40 family metallo-hydrolase [Vicinamibacterales bacterium]|jgi:acetylornithine deacetylase/succinyl-diaminopimelate desuccinylase-like protein|nr:M20/M25/M40 family metallo-hydrolase [Vicinamibacterales bacterium]